MSTAPRPWYAELTRYHWFVLVVAALGWLFDTMDQQLFVLARKPAMEDLLGTVVSVSEIVSLKPQDFAKAGLEDRGSITPTEVEQLGEDSRTKLEDAVRSKRVDKFSGWATSIFLLGWATGGLGFGVLGDRIGRARTMLLTILIYSIFTGLSAAARGFWDFAFYRFLTGLGVGGEFAVGVALVAEVMPDRARTSALGWLQALSAVGNVTAAVINMGLAQTLPDGLTQWRIMFMVGTLPALLAIFIRRRLKEPERWQHAVEEGQVAKKAGSYAELFGDPRWRRHALVGLVLAFAGVVGLWGIGFFAPDLTQSVLRKRFVAEGLSESEIRSKVGFWSSMVSVMQNLGGFFGIYAFSRVTQHIGRRPAFAASFILATASTAMVFAYLDDFSEIFWMIPIMGFCQLSIFGGYAIYFPELFPTRLRSTGTSFCYNVGRFVAAIGPYGLGLLASEVFSGHAEPMRPAGLTMCGVFLIGLLVLPFAPETRGKPLPD